MLKGPGLVLSVFCLYQSITKGLKVCLKNIFENKVLTQKVEKVIGPINVIIYNCLDIYSKRFKCSEHGPRM